MSSREPTRAPSENPAEDEDPIAPLESFEGPIADGHLNYSTAADITFELPTCQSP